jgi:fatty acid desaturase
MSGGLMTLSEARQAYYEHSGKASDAARQLAFAGIALIWIFKKDVNGIPNIGSSFVPATKWFIVALAADLTQYICATIAWGAFARWREQQPQTNATTEFDAPRWLNWPGNAFFVAKIFCVAAAYRALSLQIWNLLQGP